MGNSSAMMPVAIMTSSVITEGKADPGDVTAVDRACVPQSEYPQSRASEDKPTQRDNERQTLTSLAADKASDGGGEWLTVHVAL